MNMHMMHEQMKKKSSIQEQEFERNERKQKKAKD
jgi:hypothetical protein